MVFFRKIFILQLAGLVLTYNFTDCDFEKIKMDYHSVIFPDLDSFLNGIKCTHCISCENPPDCLGKIELLTFHPVPGCPSLAQELFVERTKATLSVRCPGYSGLQINTTRIMKTRKKRGGTINKCQDRVSSLRGLWARFTRF